MTPLTPDAAETTPVPKTHSCFDDQPERATQVRDFYILCKKLEKSFVSRGLD
jgi:hypothetical protein